MEKQTIVIDIPLPGVIHLEVEHDLEHLLHRNTYGFHQRIPFPLWYLWGMWTQWLKPNMIVLRFSAVRKTPMDKFILQVY